MHTPTYTWYYTNTGAHGLLTNNNLLGLSFCYSHALTGIFSKAPWISRKGSPKEETFSQNFASIGFICRDEIAVI